MASGLGNTNVGNTNASDTRVSNSIVNGDREPNDVSDAGGVSYFDVLSKAWPIILANAAVPLLGLVDTAVIGHFGTTRELAGLAIASLSFSFLYWSFGFLRMATTAYVAQADGAKDEHALMLVVLQSAVIACLIALVLVVLSPWLYQAAMLLLAPPLAVQPVVEGYFFLRILSAPATLLTYVLLGYFIGRGESRWLLTLQLILNGSNALFDIVLAGWLDMGIRGVALGTVLAECLTLVIASIVVARQHDWRSFVVKINRSILFQNAGRLLKQNSNIFLRTLFLLLSFAFFTRTSAKFGEAVLAANHILLQFVSFSAFFLDGYAHVLESYAGRAIGQRSKPTLLSALKVSSVLAMLTAIGLALLIYFLGPAAITALTNKPEVISVAVGLLPFAALYVACSVAAFQLDGLFIGAAFGSAMRNASIISYLVFIGLWFSLFQSYGIDGLWWAFIAYVVARAIGLLLFLSRLLARNFA